MLSFSEKRKSPTVTALPRNRVIIKIRGLHFQNNKPHSKSIETVCFERVVVPSNEVKLRTSVPQHFSHFQPSFCQVCPSIFPDLPEPWSVASSEKSQVLLFPHTVTSLTKSGKVKKMSLLELFSRSPETFEAPPNFDDSF